MGNACLQQEQQHAVDAMPTTAQPLLPSVAVLATLAAGTAEPLLLNAVLCVNPLLFAPRVDGVNVNAGCTKPG